MNVCAVHRQARSVHTYIGAINILPMWDSLRLLLTIHRFDAVLPSLCFFGFFCQVLSQSSIVFSVLEEQRMYISITGGDQFMVRSDTMAKVLLYDPPTFDSSIFTISWECHCRYTD